MCFQSHCWRNPNRNKIWRKYTCVITCSNRYWKFCYDSVCQFVLLSSCFPIYFCSSLYFLWLLVSVFIIARCSLFASLFSHVYIYIPSLSFVSYCFGVPVVYGFLGLLLFLCYFWVVLCLMFKKSNIACGSVSCLDYSNVTFLLWLMSKDSRSYLLKWTWIMVFVPKNMQLYLYK